MFRKRRLDPHEYNDIDKGLLDLHFTSFYTPTPVDEFTLESVDNPEGSQSITLTSDIAMLFNQQRLDKCSRESLLHYFDSLSVSSSSLSDLRSKMSDDELIAVVKSRYIQSPSELLAYSNSLVTQYGKEFADLMVVPSPDPVDPSPSPNPEDE